MTTRNTLMRGASRFAHLAGFARAGAAAEDDRDDEPKAKKGSRAEDDDDKGDDEPKGKKGSRAEDDDDDKGDDEPKGKKGSRAEDDDDKDPDAEDEDDDEREMSGKSATAAARRRERARCAAIFATPAAAANPALAASLAFDTTMVRSQAIAVLKGQGGSAPRAAGRDTYRRSSRNPDLDASEGGGSTTQAVSSSWDRALTRVHGHLRGEAPKR